MPPARKARAKSRATAPSTASSAGRLVRPRQPSVSGSFTITINGRPREIRGLAPTTTLLEYLRANGYTGAKQGCAEGDCGACTVALVEQDCGGKTTFRALNSCVALLPMLAGREIVTVEALAEGGRLHPVQDQLVRQYGSQCGYCTPGVVMSLFEAYYRLDRATPRELAAQLSGNLCRCTGYRPIRDAALCALEGPRDAADPFASRLRSPRGPISALDYEAGGARFLRPTTLEGLFDALARFPQARLVGGATEIGVDVTKKGASFPVLVSTEGVPGLTAVRCTPSHWRIGGAATLTDIEETAAAELPVLARMLGVFASRGIRNRATMAGNLATASPIGDCAPVLLALDASLVLASGRGERRVAIDEFFLGYRKTALGPGEIIREILIPRSSSRHDARGRSDFLKVSKRRELDISIVAACFRVDLDDDGTVRRARLAYGGVAPTPRRARAAEAALAGRRLGEARAAVADLLAQEFQPIDDVRGSAAYRRGLVASLWEKFVSGETGMAQDGPLDFERAEPPEPPAPADASRSLHHESARGHVTGGAQFVDDAAQRRPMLEAWPVCSRYARARILRRDAARARREPGITAVLLAEDIPGLNDTGTSKHDEPLLAAEDVRYHGQIVALVVGDTLEACRRAAALVEVDYEPLPPILGIEQAEDAGSWHTDPHTLTRGDCERALAEAPRRMDGEFFSGGQEHFYLETQAAWAEPGEAGTLFVCSSTQHPSEIQGVVAEVLALPRASITVQAPRMGGGFGGKEVQGSAVGALVALAAARTGRAVRMQLDRDLDIQITGKRHPFLSRFSVGYDHSGRILAARVSMISDGGWSLDLSQPILDRALFHLDNVYYIPHAHFTGRVARTNTTSQTAMRGFGGPQAMLVIEEVMDRIAREVGRPPEEVRAANLYHGHGQTATTPYKQDIGDVRLQEIWAAVLADAGFEGRRGEIARWNAAHPMVKRGLAVTALKFGISFTFSTFNQAGALVLVYRDGTVQVNHGGTEMGQGLYTKLRGVAMRELGVTASAVRMMPTSTEKVPNTPPTAASSGSDLNGAALADACITLRGRLAPLAARLLEEKGGGPVSPAEVCFEDGSVHRRGAAEPSVPFAAVCEQAWLQRLSLSATGFYATPGITWDWARQEGRPFHYFACGAAVSEVEVDGYTGMHRVLRVDIVHDVGDSLNPGVDRGQVEGGFVQGMGWLTREELRWDRDGKLLTHGASTYQVPAVSDAPREFRVRLLPRSTPGSGAVHGSKAVGEPPLMLAISVREAIRDAVAAFGPPGGQVPLDCPATCEAIFSAVQARRARPA